MELARKEGSNELTNEKEGSTWRWTREQTKDGCKERKLGPSDGKKDLAVGKNNKLTGRGAPLPKILWAGPSNLVTVIASPLVVYFQDKMKACS